jgi:hypothetical protein
MNNNRITAAPPSHVYTPLSLCQYYRLSEIEKYAGGQASSDMMFKPNFIEIRQLFQELLR